ncbi:MAG: pentapeptide repeat-containing protein [Ruminococcus sp.]
MAESSFRNCRLERTQFDGCDIRKADFRESCGYLIDITSNKIKNAKFSYPEVVRLLDALDIQIE